MAAMIVKVILCIVIPVLFLCGILDKQGRYIAIAVCCGCLVCLVAYYLNTLLQGTFNCSHYYLTTSIAPFVEESAKFIPILIFSQTSNVDRRRLLSFAFSVGMGFAIVENSYMLAQSLESSTISWMLVRGIGTGLMHGMSTAIVGMGLISALKERRLALTGTTAALFFAMMYHGAYNAMIMTDGIKYFSIFIPLISYAAVLAIINKEQIKKLLEE